MERDINSDEFEQFLQTKADQYKIYPSETSWKKIYNALHPGRSRFRMGAGLLLLTGFFFASQKIFFNNTDKKALTDKTSPSSAKVSNISRVESHNQVSKIPFTQQAGVTQQNLKTPYVVNGNNRVKATSNRRINAYSQTSRQHLNHHVINTESALSRLNVPEGSSGEMATSTFVETEDLSMDAESLTDDESPTTKAYTPIRLTQARKNRLDLQFYFSPTISYRRLADNKFGISNQRNIPLASNYSNINRFVDHNPSIGAEFGSNVLWKTGRNFTIKSGLQLNYSRYSIKAYKFYFEKASIALNPVGRVADTLTSYTSFRNFSGYSPEILQNQYLQVSVPIGAELKLFGNKRLQLNVAGTIQPSYLLINDIYLLSTDYVNYAKEPSLVQKWNIHSSFETFISYKTGGVRWQVGPQFRYQLLSSYNDGYPIKEYLMEYGVKVGVSKTLK